MLDLVWSHVLRSLGRPPASAPQISVKQDAPAASGLATSSALAMCLLQVTREACGARALTRDELIETAFELEKRDANGGGMDQLCIGHGGAFLLDGESDAVPRVIDQSVWPDEWCFVIIDSGIPKHTPTLIAEVRHRLAAGDPFIQRYVEVADRCATDIWSAIRDRELDDVKALLDQAHCAMRDYQCSSTPHLERLRVLALDCGHDGFKLSGAGGGGALFTISTLGAAPRLVEELQSALRSERDSARVVLAHADHRGTRTL